MDRNQLVDLYAFHLGDEKKEDTVPHLTNAVFILAVSILESSKIIADALLNKQKGEK